MRIIETIGTASKALNSNKARTFLTMLGVIIGVFSVVTLVAFGKGIQNFIASQFDAMGSNLLFVAPGKVELNDDPAKAMTNNKLEKKHLDLIENYAKDYVVKASPFYSVTKNTSFKNKTYSATVVGGDEFFKTMFNIKLTKGRDITRNEVGTKSEVVVIGPLVAEEYFSNTDPLGKSITVAGEKFKVIGVQGEKGRDYDDNIRMPYTTFEDILELDNFSAISVKVIEGENMDRALNQIEKALLRDLREDEFTVLSPQEILSSLNNILGIVTAALGGIAGISLVVGGIGIMNIMLVSVTERTKEIGLRKAVGATPMNIGIQFLLESIFISVTGGTIGLFFGFLVTLIAQRWFEAEITTSAVILAFTFSVFVGMVFGTYPALNAAKKDPIDALRFE